jgi:hypothetical protein
MASKGGEDPIMSFEAMTEGISQDEDNGGRIVP